MGQYWNPVLTQTIKGQSTTRIISRIYNCIENGHKHQEREFAKLTEFSYIDNWFMLAVAKQLYNRKGRLVFVGDYAELDEVATSHDGTQLPLSNKEAYEGGFVARDENGEIVKDVDGYTVYTESLPENTKVAHLTYNADKGFDLMGKVFINHTTKEYIDIDNFYELSKFTWDNNDAEIWCMSPISLMTAVGNDRGGGDYHDQFPCFNRVGSWAYDELEIKDKNKLPKGYTELQVRFTEQETVDVRTQELQ